MDFNPLSLRYITVRPHYNKIKGEAKESCYNTVLAISRNYSTP